MSVEIQKADPATLKELGVQSWPIWEKEVSQFDWVYDEPEVFFVLEGRARVKVDGGPVVEFCAGDLVRFSTGVHCTWTVLEAIRKHYRFG
ncbi:MAG TPA: cupin domain-containing protein [Fibrobacteraceae bacterium]|nr:cupin domain-containing protein [Fibrobacteraceae bacterium]